MSISRLANHRKMMNMIQTSNLMREKLAETGKNAIFARDWDEADNMRFTRLLIYISYLTVQNYEIYRSTRVG